MAASRSVTRITILMLTLYYISLISANNSLHCNYYRNCICADDVVAFVCSVSDGVATVWRGSIFNCPLSGNEIILRHSNFEHETSAACSDGDIVAYSSEVTSNGSYISQLNLTVSPEMHNGTIECIRDDVNGMSVTVGTCTLILTTGKCGEV